MAHATTYDTTLHSFDDRNTGIVVPDSVIEEWNVGRRVPVIVNVNGFEYQSTIVFMHGIFVLPFSSDKRKATGLGAHDPITVTLTHDVSERTVEVPDDLAAALAEAGVREAFDKLSYSRRKEHARSVTDAKQPATRARRIASVLASLTP